MDLGIEQPHAVAHSSFAIPAFPLSLPSDKSLLNSHAKMFRPCFIFRLLFGCQALQTSLSLRNAIKKRNWRGAKFLACCRHCLQEAVEQSAFYSCVKKQPKEKQEFTESNTYQGQQSQKLGVLNNNNDNNNNELLSWIQAGGVCGCAPLGVMVNALQAVEWPVSWVLPIPYPFCSSLANTKMQLSANGYQLSPEFWWGGGSTSLHRLNNNISISFLQVNPQLRYCHELLDQGGRRNWTDTAQKTCSHYKKM